MHEHAHHLDPETVDLISNRDKSEVHDSRHAPRYFAIPFIKSPEHNGHDILRNFARQMKDVVKKHLATSEAEAPPVPEYNPANLN